MKSLMLIAMITLPTTAFAVENSSKLEAYKQRRAARRAYALEARRQYNASKGPHVYRTSTAAAVPFTPFIAIAEGWVRQPAIPMRPVVGFSYYQPHFHAAYSRHRAGDARLLVRK